MPLGYAEVLDQCIGVDGQFQLLEQFSRPLAHSLPIQPLGFRMPQVVSHIDIFGDTQFEEHGSFLMDGYNTSLLGIDSVLEIQLTAFHGNGSTGWEIHSGKNFHQCRFPRTVLPYQSVDFTCSHREVHVVQGLDPREKLREVAYGQQRLCHR